MFLLFKSCVSRDGRERIKINCGPPLTLTRCYRFRALQRSENQSFMTNNRSREDERQTPDKGFLSWNREIGYSLKYWESNDERAHNYAREVGRRRSSLLRFLHWQTTSSRRSLTSLEVSSSKSKECKTHRRLTHFLFHRNNDVVHTFMKATELALKRRHLLASPPTLSHHLPLCLNSQWKRYENISLRKYQSDKRQQIVLLTSRPAVVACRASGWSRESSRSPSLRAALRALGEETQRYPLALTHQTDPTTFLPYYPTWRLWRTASLEKDATRAFNLDHNKMLRKLRR